MVVLSALLHAAGAFKPDHGSVTDRKDTVPPAGTAGENRMTAWSIAIGVTVLARVAAYWSVGQLQLILKWMALYTVIFELTVITAFWDAHESFNPFHKWVKVVLLMH